MFFLPVERIDYPKRGPARDYNISQLFCNSLPPSGYTLDMPRELPKYALVLAIAALIVANVLVYLAIFIPRELEIRVLEVGEKSATLVRTSDNITILIDAGKDASILRALGETLSPWRRSIDVVVLTEASARTGGGLPDVMSRYRVSNLVRFGAEGSKSFETALAAAINSEEGLHQATAPYGTRLSSDGVSIHIISPSTFSVSYGTTVLDISSTTPKGTYVLNEGGWRETK